MSVLGRALQPSITSLSPVIVVLLLPPVRQVHPYRHHDQNKQHKEHDFQCAIATIRRNAKISFDEVHLASLPTGRIGSSRLQGAPRPTFLQKELVIRVR